MKFLTTLNKNSGQTDIKTVFAVIGIIIVGIFAGKVMAKSSFIVMAVVIGMTAFILCFISFKAALFMLIFSMLLSPEFGERRTEGGGATIRLDDLLLVIIAFGWLARTAVFKETSLIKRTPVNRFIFYYVISCVFSTAIGMMLGRVELVKGSFFVIKYIEYFVVFFMAINYIHERKQIKQFLGGMFITLLIVCLVALSQLPSGERITAPFEGKGGEPNTLGGYILLLLSILVGIILTLPKSTSRKYKMGLVAFAGLSFIIILFTQSRGSWLAAVPMLMTFIVISKRRYVLIACFVVIAPFATVIAPKAVKERFAYTFEKQKGQAARIQEKVRGVTLDTSSSERISSWREGFKAFYKHPVLGWGITGWRFLDAQYVKTLVEQGFLGLVAFLGMIYALLKETRKIYLDTDDPLFKGVAMGFFAGIVAMMVHGISTNTFIIIRIMEPFWFLAAIVLNIPQVLESEKIKEKEADGDIDVIDKETKSYINEKKASKTRKLSNVELIRQAGRK